MMIVLIAMLALSVYAIFGRQTESIGQFSTEAACNRWIETYWNSPSDYYCSCCRINPQNGLYMAECLVDVNNECTDEQVCSSEPDYSDICGETCAPQQYVRLCWTDNYGDSDIWWYNSCLEKTSIAEECAPDEQCSYDNGGTPFCNSENSCSDSDGRNIHIKGYVLDNGERVNDICVNDVVVREYQCGSGGHPEIAFHEDIDCPGGEVCSNGKCVDGGVCTDSDGGKNYFTVGTTSNDVTSHTDVCVNQAYLNEYWCSNDGVTVLLDNHHCGAGNQCINGKCVAQNGLNNLSGHFENVVIPTTGDSNRNVRFTGDFIPDVTGKYIVECGISRNKDWTGLTLVSSQSFCDGDKAFPGVLANLTAGVRYPFDFTAKAGFWGGEYTGVCYAYDDCWSKGGVELARSQEGTINIQGVKVWQSLVLIVAIVGLFLLVLGLMGKKKIGKRGNAFLTVGIIFVVMAIFLFLIFGMGIAGGNDGGPGDSPGYGNPGMKVSCTATIKNDIGADPKIEVSECHKSAECQGGLFSFTKGLVLADEGAIKMSIFGNTKDSVDYRVEDFGGRVNVVLNSNCIMLAYTPVDLILYKRDAGVIDSATHSVSP